MSRMLRNFDVSRSSGSSTCMFKSPVISRLSDPTVNVSMNDESSSKKSVEVSPFSVLGGGRYIMTSSNDVEADEITISIHSMDSYSQRSFM